MREMGREGGDGGRKRERGVSVKEILPPDFCRPATEFSGPLSTFFFSPPATVSGQVGYPDTSHHGASPLRAKGLA